MEQIRIEEVKRANSEHGFSYFSPETMRFFSSKVSKSAYKIGNKAYFITSEQNKLSGNNPRKWTIRVADLKTGLVHTVGEFQEFNTHGEAKKQLKRILLKEVNER